MQVEPEVTDAENAKHCHFNSLNIVPSHFETQLPEPGEDFNLIFLSQEYDEMDIIIISDSDLKVRIQY